MYTEWKMVEQYISVSTSCELSGLVNTGFCFSFELCLQKSHHYYVCAFQHTNQYIIQNQYFNHKETIVHGHDHHNTTILSNVHNIFFNILLTVHLSIFILVINQLINWLITKINIHNMSTTCFGQYYFCPSSGWIQLSEKTTQYNMIQYNHQLHCFLMF